MSRGDAEARGCARSVWLVDHAPILGGAELFALKLAAHAAARDDLDVTLLCPAGSELEAAAQSRRLPVRAVAMPHFAAPAEVWRIPSAVARLAAALRGSRRGTVLVANTAWAQALVAACAPGLRGRPIVHLLHEQDTAARPTARATLRHVGRPVAIGANGVRTYREALDRDVVHVNNVLSDEELVDAACAPRRRALGSTAGPPAVGVLARLIPEKGIIELVDELAANPRAWNTALVAGPPQDAAYVEAVRGRIEQHGLSHRVRVEGPRHAEEVLDTIDVLVVPSTGSEGQPTVVLEALARGVPAVLREPVYSSDFEGLPVSVYRGAGDLAAALKRLPAEPASLDEIAARFGAGQALETLLAAGRAWGSVHLPTALLRGYATRIRRR